MDGHLSCALAKRDKSCLRRNRKQAGWLRGTVVERWTLTGELSMTYS